MPIVGRALATAATVFALSLVLGRGFAMWVDRTVPPHSKFWLVALERDAAMLDAAHRFRVDAAFIGTSSVWLGFDPKVFDAALAERGHRLTSFNFGVVPLPDQMRRLLVREVCAAHRARGTRWRLLLYELSPADWLEEQIEINRSENDAFERQIEAMNLDPGKLALMFLHDPAHALTLLGHSVFGYHAPFAVVNALKSHLYDDLIPDGMRELPPPEMQPMYERFLAWQHMLDLQQREPWQDDTRGFLPPHDDETRAAYDALLRANHTDDAFAGQRDAAATGAVFPLDVSAAAVQRSIDLIRETGTCPERVVLVVMPLSPVMLEAVPPAARERVADTIDTIARTTGFPVVNLLELPLLTLDDYFDGLHVSQTRGARITSTELAARVAELLPK